MESKTCYKCATIKDKSEFYKSKKQKDGLQPYCKECNTQINTAYRRSFGGWINCKYNEIESRSIGVYDVGLSKIDFKKWILSLDNFQDIWDGWVKSGYDIEFAPSVDRIDDYKGYVIGNIQLMTWKENREKAVRDKLSGKNTKTSIAVVQYSKGGNIIGEYKSLAIAERETGVLATTISACCNPNKINKTGGGYIWKKK